MKSFFLELSTKNEWKALPTVESLLLDRVSVAYHQLQILVNCILQVQVLKTALRSSHFVLGKSQVRISAS
jgi:hypothetical protein